jgi:histone deacetylase 11
MIIVYHPRYRYGSGLLDPFHPFQFDRAGEVFALLQTSTLAPHLDALLRAPPGPATLQQLSAVHDTAYLAKVCQSRVVASVIEIPKLAWCPAFLMRRWFIEPSLWCVAGTVMAAREAIKKGLAFNIGGGFHHARRNCGEAFCLFSDVALAIWTLRSEGILGAEDLIFYVDLDAHQGNGVSRDFATDAAVKILDIYNSDVYPFRDPEGLTGVDIACSLRSGTADYEYLGALDSGLEALFAEQPSPRLVIYNAGTDVYEGDLLGGLKLSHGGVNLRDLKVLEAVRGRGIPLLVLASGGYSKNSATLIAEFMVAASLSE